MTAQARPALNLALLALPVAAILAMRIASHGDWAAANPLVFALLFVWVAADTLALSAIARRPDAKAWPGQSLAALATACIVVPVAAAPPVRAAIFDLPALVSAMALTVLAFAAWKVRFVARTCAAGEPPGQAIAALFPPALLRFARLEAATMRHALLGWRARPDVPPGTRSFAYHTYLVPMIATLTAE